MSYKDCTQIIFSSIIWNETTRTNFKKDFKNFRSRTTPQLNYVQLWYKSRAFHFEVWIKRGKLIEVGLHLETSRKKSLKTLDHFREKEGIVKARIPKVKFDGDWGPRTHWCKIYEEIPYLAKKRLIEVEPDLVKQVSDLLTRYIEALEPDLERLA